MKNNAHASRRNNVMCCLPTQVSMEPASRNQQVVGGKGQKRKRSKKEVIKPPRKKRKGTACSLLSKRAFVFEMEMER